MRDRPRLHHFLLLLPLAGIAVWLAVRAQDRREDPAAVLKALRQASGPTLPEAAAAGASGRTEPTAYDTRTIFDYIDGAAEAYIARGFERCLAATFTFRQASGASFEVIAEVYRFGAAEGARGQLAAEKPGSAVEVTGVPGAVADSVTLLAQRGKDYLKLTALAEAPEVPGALERLAVEWQKGPA